METDDIPIGITLQHYAFFFDIDGTLADICSRPDKVRIPPARLSVLSGLADAGGAWGVVSGRPLMEIDALLFPLRVPAAGVHGAQMRADPHQSMDTALMPLPSTLLRQLQNAAAALPGIFLEQKGEVAVAVHYRACPQYEAEVTKRVEALIRADTRWALQHGKCVVEVRPAAVDKGKALQVLMQAPCFAGRRPLFIGDDLSDEAGFAAAQALGGKGIRVGEGHTRADYRLANPDAVEAWLKRLMTPQGVRACANEWEDAS